eukprot:m.24296 g.24296  ORF g.24296 m.24296 type:complete len:341 (+) comp3994_c0_seq2:169-1191(+)
MFYLLRRRGINGVSRSDVRRARLNGACFATGHEETVALICTQLDISVVGDRLRVKQLHRMVSDSQLTLLPITSLRAPRDERPVETWTVDDVGEWLQEIRFAEFKGIFKEHRIAGDVFQSFTPTHLNDDMLVTPRPQGNKKPRPHPVGDTTSRLNLITKISDLLLVPVPPALPPFILAPPLPPGQRYHAFLSHNWGDAPDHSNHQLVMRVCCALRDLGLSLWFDEERLSGDILREISDGLEASATVVCFITQAYLNKVQRDPRDGDYCQMEFSTAHGCRSGRMIAVPVEEGVLVPRRWPTQVFAAVGRGIYHARLTPTALQAADGFHTQVRRLAAHIVSML